MRARRRKDRGTRSILERSPLSVARFARVLALAAALAAAVLLRGAAPARAKAPAPPDRLRAAIEAFSIDSLFAHLERLGSDAMAGRGTGTPGGDAAADYLAARLREYGLRPMGGDGTYFQRIPMRGSFPLPESRLEIARGDSIRSLALGDDYLLYTMGEETHVPRPAPLFFAGYGIVAPEYDYDDYYDRDVEGAIVVFLEGEPPSEDPDYFAGAFPTIHSHPEWKQRVAIARGARGSVMIPARRGPDSPSWEERRSDFAFEHVTLPYDVPRNLNVVVREGPARLLFERSPHTLEDVFEMHRTGTMRSFPLAASMSFRGAFRERDFLASNVLGLLDGRDPLLRETCLVLSAHYDHLGTGPSADGDSIYNGVVDNAIGCAGLLEIARVLAVSGRKPLRPILFAFLTAEEKGLLGARHYALHPAVPLSRTIAAVNVQGLAIFDEFEDVIGIGAEYSTIEDVLAETAASFGLAVSAASSEHYVREAFARSDQFAFAQAGIPSVLVVEGVRGRRIGEEGMLGSLAAWTRERYHTPFDDLSQPIDRSAVLLHGRVILSLAFSLAETYAPPQWKAGSEYARARLRSIAEGR